jgi:hypothetical protein
VGLTFSVDSGRRKNLGAASAPRMEHVDDLSVLVDLSGS